MAHLYRRYVPHHTVSSDNAGSEETDVFPQVTRTSALQAPIMELTGHSSEVFAARFDPTGQNIASGSMDRSISKTSS